MTKGKKDVEDEYSAKLDMCLTDGIVKTGGGVLLGTLTSVLFLGRRRWPIIAGLGVGIGLAYANCEYELNPKKNNTA
ncbi:MICOS complex subunit Mic10-like [Achroia grisella]|uniref:MICOS complex subunit Mic10-like n=1 Tax=Achroia grisella TaxID=688607 RepID=UPI0027D29474|nr:MICOS complex subunit Mic10-like [Achroia grisella]